jgi:hypothetical protein
MKLEAQKERTRARNELAEARGKRRDCRGGNPDLKSDAEWVAWCDAYFGIPGKDRLVPLSKLPKIEVK